MDQTRVYESRTGGRYRSSPVKAVKCWEYHVVVVEVTGIWYYTGSSSFSLGEDDVIGREFLML